MKIKTIICKIIVIMMFPSWLFAQSEYFIKGVVYGDNEALIGANIQLTSTKNIKQISGTTTDLNGTFSISLPKGNYQLEITYVGYNKYITNVEVNGHITLPPIILSENAQLMNEVVVTARTITYQPNGYIAEISKNALYRNKDMSSILRLTPGTHVTPKGIKAYGESVSKVYVNGRELKLYGEQLINYLQTIQGRNVREMEVIIASGVEDDATSAGQSILKITTINPETGGLLGIGGTGGLRINTHTYGGNTNLQWRMNKHWGMYLNLIAMNSQMTTGTKMKSIFYETAEKRTNEMEDEAERHNYRSTLGFTYDWNANNLFSIEGNYSHTPSSNNQWNRTLHWEKNESIITANGLADGERDFNSFNLSFLYLHKFGKNGELTFKAESFNNQVEESEVQQYQYATGSNQGHSRLNEEDNQLYTFKADYTHKFPNVKGKLSAGVKAHWLTNDNNTDYLATTDGEQDLIRSYTDKYKYSEDIYALYAKYNFTWKKFNINVGLRMEHSLLSPESTTNPERNEENNYTDFFPEVGISYSINKEEGHNTNLSYNKRIRRPSISSLNPLIRRTSEYSYSMGNTALKPYYTHNFSWTTHLFHKYILHLSYNYSDNGFISLSENQEGNIYATQYNGGQSSDLKIYGSIPVQIGKKVRLSFSAGYSHGKTSYKEDNRSYNSWSTGFSGMFNLPAGIDVMADLYYSPPTKSLYGKTYYRPLGNLHISKSFLKEKLNVTLLAGDLFDQVASMRSEYHYDTFYQETRGSKRNYGAVLRIRYNLRWGQKSNVQKAGSSSDSERFGTE